MNSTVVNKVNYLSVIIFSNMATIETGMNVFFVQTGAFLPFYRSHSHIDTKRREPWMYDAQTLAVVKDSLRLRYTFLPLWYTTFYQHNITGSPVIRPLWVEFPQDKPTFTIDNQLLIGKSLKICVCSFNASNIMSIFSESIVCTATNLCNKLGIGRFSLYWFLEESRIGRLKSWFWNQYIFIQLL